MEKTVEILVSEHFEEADWNALRKFCDKTCRLIGTRVVAEGDSAIRGSIRFSKDQGFIFEGQLPSEEKISEFLMAFRFFYLQKEVTSFPRVLNIIGRYSRQPEAHQAIKVYKQQWKNSLFRDVMRLSLNGKPITTALLLDLWLNGHYFHSNDEKYAELQELCANFSEDFTKYMLLDATYEATKVVFKLYDGVRAIVEEHFAGH